MDTVLGLSLSPTRVGWVLVEGHDAEGDVLDHDEFAVGASVRAGNAAERATAAVLQTRAAAGANGQRLHAIGVTWSDDAAVDAALLLESLTDAGFDNVVQVRASQAAAALTRPVNKSRAPLAFAHGAAQASTLDAEFLDEQPVQPHPVAHHSRSRPLSYVGAVTMLVAGVLSFVISLSLAVGLQLAPDRPGPSAVQVAATPVPPSVAEPQAPVPPAHAAIQPVASQPDDQAEEPASQPDGRQSDEPASQSDATDPGPASQTDDQSD